jgi:1,4-dihydroxy-6-naphthoate synthase
VVELRERTILVPGEMTTAFLALSLLLGRGRFRHRTCMFDQILERVAAGEADAGLIIHEGQLTYANHRLHPIVDLGQWWKAETGLPLPLGGNVIRRDLGLKNMTQIAAILRDSIAYGLTHREEAVAHSMAYARDMGRELADRFVGMYVNQWTLDYGPAGREAVRQLLGRGCAAGLVPGAGEIDFVFPS